MFSNLPLSCPASCISYLNSDFLTNSKKKPELHKNIPSLYLLHSNDHGFLSTSFSISLKCHLLCFFPWALFFICLVVVVQLLNQVQLLQPLDGSLPGSSVHGILQARILEWVAISFSRVYLCGFNYTPPVALSRKEILRCFFSHTF